MRPCGLTKGLHAVLTPRSLCHRAQVVASTRGSGLNLTVGSWQRVQLSRAGRYLSASVGGQLLANTSLPPAPQGSVANFSLRLMLSHYFVAAVDNLVVQSLQSQGAGSHA